MRFVLLLVGLSALPSLACDTSVDPTSPPARARAAFEERGDFEAESEAEPVTPAAGAADADADDDGLTDAFERSIGTDPANADTDGDGVSDGLELAGCTSPYDPPAGRTDTDGDTVPDDYEAAYGTDPNNADTDGGGVSDGDELWVYGSNPTDPSDDAAAGADSDGDLVSDLYEGYWGTDPNNADTDGGGVDDGTEIQIDGTNPNDARDDGLGTWADSDGDWLADGDEVYLGTDPRDADSDDGGVSDGEELYVSGTDPLDASDDGTVPADTDGDGLSDVLEGYLGTSPTEADTDGDGVDDYTETYIHGTDPTATDTAPADDAAYWTDSDGDWLVDADEAYLGTDPNDADSDDGGTSDGEEIFVLGTNPRDPSDDATEAVDSDGDGLSDVLEGYVGTSAALADTDGGGASDYQEVWEDGTDPLAPSDDIVD